MTNKRIIPGAEAISIEFLEENQTGIPMRIMITNRKLKLATDILFPRNAPVSCINQVIERALNNTIEVWTK